MKMSAEEIGRCRNFLSDPGISIVKEARIAQEAGGVTAMHDVTEGGIATALEELGEAGGHRLRICLDHIPILPETHKICGLLGVDPLGLIGSGSLLITCSAGLSHALARRLEEQGIPAALIGEVLEAGIGIAAVHEDGKPANWPHFEVDEIARLFESRARAQRQRS
jgi:hydrogenase maturation factor